MPKTRLPVLVLIAILSRQQAVRAQSPQPGPGSSESAMKFVVGPSSVLMPSGIFLLVRKGKEIGAIRFTGIGHGASAGVGKASYDSYFQGDGSGSLAASNVIKQSGEINVERLKGVGRVSFQFGKTKVRIGKWSFACNYPGRLDMWPYYRDQRDYGYEFAPTSARDVNEIDSADARLRWFKFDPNTRVDVPVSDLPSTRKPVTR